MRRAWRSVFTAMNSTPRTPASTMRFTAFVPPPPTPTTLMTAKCSEPGMFGISSSTPVAFYCCVCLVSARRCSGAPCGPPKGGIYAGHCTRCPFVCNANHRQRSLQIHEYDKKPTASRFAGRQSGATRAVDSSRNRAPTRAPASEFSLPGKTLGRRRPPRFLQQIASYKRLDAGEKARRSFHICKTPGREHSLRGFQKVPHPPRRLQLAICCKNGGVRRPRDRDTCYGRRGREGRPRSPPTGKIARGFARGSQRGADRRLSGPQCRWSLSPAWRADAPVEEKASAGRSILGAREREPYTARQVGRSGTRTLM